jgi:hypothetical protein
MKFAANNNVLPCVPPAEQNNLGMVVMVCGTGWLCERAGWPKAAEGRRTPRRFALAGCLVVAKRLGVRQSSGAFGRAVCFVAGAKIIRRKVKMVLPAGRAAAR